MPWALVAVCCLLPGKTGQALLACLPPRAVTPSPSSSLVCAWQMFARVLLASALVVAVVTATSAPAEDRVAMFARTRVPAGWSRLGASPLDTVVPLKFAVKQRNLDGLMKLADEVSNPASPAYGKVREWRE